jgi:SAM-dependent methyltransferase
MDFKSLARSLARPWSRRGSPQPTLPPGIVIGAGFHADEGGWRWMTRAADFTVPAGGTQRTHTVSLDVGCGQAGYYPKFPFALRALVGGETVASVTFTDGEQRRQLRFALPASDGRVTVRLESDAAFVPAELWINGDSRELSVRVRGLGRAGERPARDSRPDMPWRCNMCGGENLTPIAALGRENPTCAGCESSVRLRALVHILANELFGRSLALPQFPVNKAIRGAGMSDPDVLARNLAARFDYTNTYYHRSPRLDVTDPDPRWFGVLDFLICSEVFEHVAPPISVAFVNARRLLKPGGVLVFSVPYGLQAGTIEHFPDLYRYELVRRDGGTWLRNVSRDGRVHEYRNLIFHGGPGATLEVRRFALASLQDEFARAGFQPPRIWGDDVLSAGIRWGEALSLPLSTRPA